jgi:hypothetical protein
VCQVKEHKASEIPSRPSAIRRAGVSPRVPKKPLHEKGDYIIGVDNQELKDCIAKGLVPTTVADSAATSGVGTINDPCQQTGKPSHKQFILPNGSVIPATKIAEYPFEVRNLSKVLHITPGISQNSLLSTVKFADANYIQFLTRTHLKSTTPMAQSSPSPKGAIFHGWQDSKSILWHIPLVRMVRNLNTNTILSNCSPSEFLLNVLTQQKQCTVSMNKKCSLS